MADAEPRTRAANQRAVTDAKIQGAALRLLATVGTDGLSLPAIAKESGLTTGPVYARYGGVDDVLVVIWDLYLRDALVRVLALQAAWVNGEDPMPDELRDLFESPSQEMNALVEVMATVRRYPFAYEVISVQIEECFTTIAAQYSHVPRSQLQLQLGFVLGAVFAMPIMPSALVDNFIEAEHLLRMMARSREGWDARSAQIDTFVVPIPIVDVEEPVRKAFLTGALNTIAITGVEGASAQRIARASGYGFSTAYNYFQSKEQLAEEAIRIVMFQLFQLNVNVNRIQNREAYINAVIAIQHGALSESGRLLRQLRVESVAAVRHSSRLSRLAQEAFSEVLVRVSESDTTSADGTFSQLATWAIIASHGFATPLISGCSQYPADIEWAPVAHQLHFIRANFKS